MNDRYHRSYAARILIAAFPAIVIITALAHTAHAAGGSVNYSCPTGWTNNPNISVTVTDPPPPPPPPPPVNSGGGGCCFIPGTMISMADGNTMLIEDLEIGDKVMGQGRKTNIIQNVIILPAEGRKIYGVNGSEPFVTVDHPLLSTDGWKAQDPVATAKSYIGLKVSQLKIGDELITEQGNIVVRQLSDAQELKGGYVYTFKTDGNHSYMANTFIAHNQSGSSGGTCSTIDIGGTGSSGCFTADTRILLANGTQKAIEKIQIGERVFGSHGTINTVLGYEHHTQKNSHQTVTVNNKITATENHPLLTTAGWKALDTSTHALKYPWLKMSGELAVGDELITKAGTEIIESLDRAWLPAGTTVYNLILDGDHTYYAGGILAHNIIQNGFISHELYQQKLISKQVFDWDQEYNDTYLLDAHVRRGYAYWARPAADRMRSSKIWTAWYAFFARSWMKHQQYILGARSRDNTFGRIGGHIVVSFFRVTGNMLTHEPQAPKIVMRLPSSSQQHACA